MQAFQKFIDTKRDECITTAAEAVAYANAHPEDATAQKVANLCSDSALAARLIADEIRYGS